MEEDNCLKAEDGDFSKAMDRAYKALRATVQLQAWRKRGYYPQLHSTPDGWVLSLDTTNRGMAEYRAGDRPLNELMRYNTELCSSPEEAVESALKVIQP